jgi:hypothetical protein
VCHTALLQRIYCKSPFQLQALLAKWQISASYTQLLGRLPFMQSCGLCCNSVAITSIELPELKLPWASSCVHEALKGVDASKGILDWSPCR